MRRQPRADNRLLYSLIVTLATLGLAALVTIVSLLALEPTGIDFKTDVKAELHVKK